MADYLIAAAVIFGVNLMPAFGPPTWSVLVILQVNLDADPLLLVPIGALSALAGRLLLARGARHFRGRFDPERIVQLDHLRDELTATRRRSGAGLGLFLLSPLPSAQLFIAAGLVDAPLRPLGIAFLVGRLISYSVYLSVATVAADNLGSLVGDSLRSPIGIAVQVLMLAGLVALVRVDWTAKLPSRMRGDLD